MCINIPTPPDETLTLAQRMELLNNKANNITMQKQQSTGKIATTNTVLATNHVVAFQESKEKSNKNISPLFGNGNQPLSSQSVNNSLILSYHNISFL